MISVVCWMWTGERQYLPAHVNALRAMYAKHLTVPHRFICIADKLYGFDREVEVIPMPAAALALGEVRSPEGANMPSCYRRLWMFSQEARDVLGERVMLTDIDCVIMGNIDHLVERTEPFVGWQPIASWGNRDRVAGGHYLMDTGAFTDVFEEFGADGIREARAAGYRGSDQAWISYKLRGRVAHWKDTDGVYALSDFKNINKPLPDAKVIHFCGHMKPWHIGAPEWVRQHYPDYLRVNFPPTDFRRLVLKHAGKRIAVLGGAPSLDEELKTVQADVWISVNEHGAKRRPVDYVVAMDDFHNNLRREMREVLREYTDAPIIGPYPTNDYQLAYWPGSPRKGLSGMVATWVASIMGGHPVILAGFDAYAGTKVYEATKIVDQVRGEVRVVGGPLAKVWKRYGPRERFAEYTEPSSLLGMLGEDGSIAVRVRKPTTVREVAVAPGMELRVMRHEVQRLLHHKMLEEI